MKIMTAGMKDAKGTKRKYNQSFTFRKIGLLYYDDDGIRPGTYFCYKILDIA